MRPFEPLLVAGGNYAFQNLRSVLRKEGMQYDMLYEAMIQILTSIERQVRHDGREMKSVTAVDGEMEVEEGGRGRSANETRQE
jgi:hypothetical protein